MSSSHGIQTETETDDTNDTNNKEDQRTIEVQVIIPVHNAAVTLKETVSSAMHQTLPEDAQDNCEWHHRLRIYVCCYDDGSTDSSWKILQDLAKNQEFASNQDNNRRVIPSQLCLGRGATSRGAGFARNRAVELRENSINDCFLCWLDSDDLMRPTRVVEQVGYFLTNTNNDDQSNTGNWLVGCTFERDPPGSTWHYADWANQLSDERLLLERYREVTVLQPTWMMHKSRFIELGGYLEAPTAGSLDDFVQQQQDSNNSQQQLLQLIHPTFERDNPHVTLRVAEDLRFFHKHLTHDGGTLRNVRTDQPLVVYRHRLGQSQSSQTSRKLLLHLRAMAFERSVLSEPSWTTFVVWGAGRDGKDFIKALQPATQRRIFCMVDVDETKIVQVGSYRNRDLQLNIPIVHFSLLIRNADQRRDVQQSLLDAPRGSSHFGRINKSKGPRKARVTEEVKDSFEPPQKSRKLNTSSDLFGSKGLDMDLLPKLPIVVCVAMYRTGGALERNVKSVNKTEGSDLWYFS